MELKNKVALVTGASKGIGKAIALILAEQGCRVTLFARTEKLLQDLAQEAMNKHGVETLAVPGDIRREEDITRCVEKTVTAFGALDVLVNNAGLGHFHSIADLSTKAWDEMFEVNVRGHFLFTRGCLPALRKTGDGAVVFVVSLAGKNAFVNGAGYAATKHAILAFSRCLMLEERKNRIRTIAVCPGSVDTSFSHPRPPDDPKRDRIPKPEDVAQVVLGALVQPARTMVSEIDIRPSNP